MPNVAQQLCTCPLTVLQTLPWYAEAGHVFGSCFTEGSFTPAQRLSPALPSPQAFCLSAELPASLLKLIAAFRSRSMTSPQSGRAGFRHTTVRSASVRLSSTHPQHEQVREEANQRSATSTRQPY